MQSRSQNGEDLFVLEYFGKGFKGMLLDVGANNGTDFSNSRLLIEHGWWALCFEPGSTYEQLDELYKDNPHIHCYKLGMGASNERVKFWESGAHVVGGTDSGLVSTTNFEETKRWPDVTFVEKEIEIVTFDTIAEYAPIDFISLDCEGSEWDILQQIDLNKVGCRCLCIEYNGDDRLKFIFTKYTEKFGMRLSLQNGENLIYTK